MPRSLTSHDLDYTTGRFWIQHDRLEEEVLTALTPHTADCSSNAVSLNQTKIAERFNHNMMDRTGQERRGEERQSRLQLPTPQAAEDCTCAINRTKISSPGARLRSKECRHTGSKCDMIGRAEEETRGGRVPGWGEGLTWRWQSGCRGVGQGQGRFWRWRDWRL
jgi:hypothetical protein